MTDNPIATFSTGPFYKVIIPIILMMACMELNVVLARTLFLYDMRMAPGAPCCANTNITAAGGECQYSTKAGLVMSRCEQMDVENSTGSGLRKPCYRP